MVTTQEQIVSAVKAAGIVGAGCAGFPAYVKLQAKNVDTVVANGSECEPLLFADKAYMKEHAGLIMDGLWLVMKATGATRGIIAVKGYYRDVVQALEKALPPQGDITIHELENVYPAGDEFVTVYETTGRVIGEGGLPLDVGVVVNNVTSLGQIAQAAGGKPVTERMITIAGEVEKPQVVSAPIGTPYADLIKLAGGATVSDPALLDGGPMMGFLVKDWEKGVAKVTSGLIVLPEDHLIIRMKRKSLTNMIRQSKAACCQCERCTDLCSRNLMGHELYPHMTMRTIDYNLAEPTKHVTSAFLCSQCGLCELVACDFMLLSPRQIYAEYRKKLVAAGIKSPHNRKDFTVHSQFEDRKVSIPMIMKKLAITRYYDRNIPYTGTVEVTRVRVPICRHIGAPAVPLVGMGQQVKMGDVIAATAEDKLGAVYHASIAGQVIEVADEYIGIGNL